MLRISKYKKVIRKIRLSKYLLLNSNIKFGSKAEKSF